jgi:hypothetical protein
MLVRCEKCGYENFPQHRFCGMCGGGLRIPQPVAAQPAQARPAPPPKPAATAQPGAPKSVSGPSFLGLADEPARHDDVSYLLEDEPSPSHWGRYVVLILLVAAVASAWHWRQDLLSWVGGPAASSSPGSELANSSVSSSPSSPPSSSPSSSQTAAATASPAEATPSTGSDAHVEKPNPGAGDQPAASQTQAAPPVAAAPAPATSASTAESAPPPQAGPSQKSTADDTSAAATTPAENSATVPKPPVKPSKEAAETTSPAAESDALEAQGEKYLYGNGVAMNCARAQRSLLAAAARSNAKAESVLGTMYATGHCATRDLPAAYRWFGRALRQDPGNTRYEEDLKVLWGQMTPDERQLALRNER